MQAFWGRNSGVKGLNLDIVRTRAVLFHQIEGHAAMDADGDGVSTEVGIVMNMVAVRPKDEENPDDIRAVEHTDDV